MKHARFVLIVLSIVFVVCSFVSACPNDFSLAKGYHLVRLQISPPDTTPVTIVPIWDRQLDMLMQSLGYINDVPDYPPPFHAMSVNTSSDGRIDVELSQVTEYRVTIENFNKTYWFYPYGDYYVLSVI
jgi:hypothetical protein